jgi:hypothetical protein
MSTAPPSLPSRRAVLVYACSLGAVVATLVVVAFLTRPGRLPDSVGGSRQAGVLQAFLAQAPREPRVLTVRCRLSEVYSPEFPRPRPFVSRQVPIGQVHDLIQQEALQGPTYQSVHMEDDEGRSIHGYALTGSPQADRLMQLLSGGPRRLSLEVQHTGASPERVLIRRIVE